jgi:multidrug efflux pump subunit AcrA (membrane-fusion protein)
MDTHLARGHNLGKIFLLMVVSLLGSCRQVQKAANNPAPRGIPVKIASAETGTVENTSEYVANLESRKSVGMQPSVGGQVSKIFVRSGDRVKAGRILMQIDRAPHGTVDSARGDAESTKAELANAQATLKTHLAEKLAKMSDLKAYEDRHRRFASLYSAGAVSRQTLQQYTDGLAIARADVGVVDERIAAQKVEIQSKLDDIARKEAAQQKVELKKDFTITAPFDGFVEDISVSVGDYVSPQIKLASLTQKELEVNIPIPVEKAPQIRLGSPVVLVDSKNQTVANSKVSFVSPKVTANTQSVLAKASVYKVVGTLRPDQYYKAKVVSEHQTGVLVPTIAVFRIGGNNFVFVPENGESGLVAKQRQIKLGVIRGNNYQVTEGLKPGERIVISGSQKIQDGVAIVPES